MLPPWIRLRRSRRKRQARGDEARLRQALTVEGILKHERALQAIANRSGGIQGGYNWQFGQWVVGLEGDIQGSGASDTFAPWKRFVCGARASVVSLTSLGSADSATAGAPTIRVAALCTSAARPGWEERWRRARVRQA